MIKFQLMSYDIHSVMVTLYHQAKIPIDIWYRQGSNSKSFI